MQKKCIIIITLLSFIILYGCKKNSDPINTNLQEVARLNAPANNKFVKLQPTTSAAVSFEWEQARAEDGSLVLYEVAIDKESGDLAKPVAVVPSDDNGIQNRLTLSHKDLNRIAGAAGIAALSTGKLKWTVYASKGFNRKKAAEDRTVEVERPNGFAEIPTDVYLTGDATEAGADLSKAIKLKLVTAGVFEVYTSLKNGKYHFTDRNTGTPKSFSVDGTVLKEGGESTQADGTKAYRLRLDFNNTVATLTEIVKAGLWFAPDNKILYDLSYAGGSVWKFENQVITFKQESWGRDERYKFRLTVKNGATQSEEWAGSANADNQRPTDATPPTFWELKPITNNDQWNYCFKFKSQVDGKNCDVNMSFKPDKAYTHEVIVR